MVSLLLQWLLRDIEDGVEGGPVEQLVTQRVKRNNILVESRCYQLFVLVVMSNVVQHGRIVVATIIDNGIFIGMNFQFAKANPVAQCYRQIKAISQTPYARFQRVERKNFMC